MIRPTKCQLVISVILACICATSFGTEPNEVKTELEFEISSENSQRWITSRGQSITGPIKASHVAKFFIKGERSYISFVGTKNIRFSQTLWDFPGPEDIKRMLQTTAGRSISQKQREFITTSNSHIVIVRMDRRKIGNYLEYRLYAVSEMDARKMVEAFVEVLSEKANATMQKYNEILHNARGKIVHIKEILPEKEVQAKAAKSKYKEIKDSRYSLLADTEAYETAKETMLQTDKMLDLLEIELAGIREKLGAIDGYRKPESLPDTIRRKRLPDGMIVKLDQMFVEQTIELKCAEARKEATLGIRDREKAFLDCFNQWKRLEREENRLRSDILQHKSDIRKIEGILANPKPYMLPPKVYQNKVTIYPVRAD